MDGGEPLGLLRMVALVTAAAMLLVTAWVSRAWNTVAAVLFVGYGLPVAVLASVQAAAALAARTERAGPLRNRP